MGAFFRMQLKIYFRLASSYISPLVIGSFYIILVTCVRLAIGTGDVQRILDSNQYIELSANFCMIASFVISSFVTQTFFYRYKNEGIEYLLYSKPIRRKHIFFTNVLASVIGLIISMALMSTMFFISQLIIPFKFTKALLSSLSFFGAGLLCATLALGIAAIVQNFVESKVFQVIVSVIPVLGIMTLGFIKFSSGTDVIQTTYQAANRPIILIPNSPDLKGDSSKAVENLNKRIKSQDDLLIENQSTANMLENQENFAFNPFSKTFKVKKRESIEELANKVKKSFYSHIYWSNFKEYYFPTFTAYDRNLRNWNVTLNYNILNNKSSVINKETGELDKDVIEYLKTKYNLDINNQILVKTTSNDLYSLGYNISNFKDIFDWDRFEEKPLFSIGFNDIQNRNFENFDEFTKKVINKILEKKNFDLIKSVLFNILGLEGYLTGTVDAVNALEIVDFLTGLTKYALLEEKHNFDLVKTKIEEKAKSEKDPNLKKLLEHLKSKSAILSYDLLQSSNFKEYSSTLDDYINARFDTKELSEIQKTRLNSYISIMRERAINAFSQLFWTINIFNIVGERQNGNFANLLETKNLIPYLSESKEKFSKFNKNYKQSIIKVVKLNDNLIELERKNYIETPTSVGITLLVSLTFITLGYLQFERKNFK